MPEFCPTVHAVLASASAIASITSANSHSVSCEPP